MDVLAGTKIENSVELIYQVGGVDYTINSNVVVDVVDQIIDVIIVSNGSSDDINPVILDFGSIEGGSTSTPIRKCGYFEVDIN